MIDIAGGLEMGYDPERNLILAWVDRDKLDHTLGIALTQLGFKDSGLCLEWLELSKQLEVWTRPCNAQKEREAAP